MGGKYEVTARNYDDQLWGIILHTNSRFKAIITWLKALRKYELVEFCVRK